MVYKWHDHHTDKFLSIYRCYSCLYDHTNPLHKKKKARDAAHREIIARMEIPGLTSRDVKNKIKTIRTNYKALLDRVLRSEREATHPSEVYVPQVFWFQKADEFLRNVVLNKHKNGRTYFMKSIEDETLITEPEDNAQSEADVFDIKLEEGEGEIEHLYQNQDQDEENPIEKYHPVDEHPTPDNAQLQLNIKTAVTCAPATEYIMSANSGIHSPAMSTSTSASHNICDTTISKPIKDQKRTDNSLKRTSEFITLEQSVSKLQKTIELHNESEETNEFDLFGKSIAVQLKRMPLERALICQENLQRVMNQERLLQMRSSQ